METMLARMGRSVKNPMKAAAAHRLYQPHSSTYTILRAVTRLLSHCLQAVSCQTAEHVGAGLCVLQQHANWSEVLPSLLQSHQKCNEPPLT